MLYTVFSLLMIFVLLLIFLSICVIFFKKSRADRIASIRNFKKGEFALIYLAAVPIYTVGHIYDGKDLVNAFFTAINKSVSLVVLRYDVSSIDALLKANVFYKVAVYFCFALVVINALTVTLSFLQRKIWAFCKKLAWYLSKNNRLYIIGNNEESIKIYDSCLKRSGDPSKKTSEEYSKMIVDNISLKISDKDSESLFVKKVGFISKSNLSDFMKKEINTAFGKLRKRSASGKNRKNIFIINTRDDDKNIAICQSVVDVLNQNFFQNGKESGDLVIDFIYNTHIYVFGDPQYETIYDNIVENSHGCIQYVNKYKQIAVDFIDKYPLSLFMDEKQIDYSTSLVGSDTNIDVVFIGFGKTGRQIFLTSVANNQFLTRENGTTCLKQVHYHIFDKEHAENNKNLNHNYYRFKNEFYGENGELAVNKNNYLPLPSFPALEEYHTLDINDPRFYKSVRSIVKKGADDVSYVIIAFGTDLENIDMAQKILEKKSEWNVNNLWVFVKVRSGNDSFPIFKRNDCFLIGDESASVYDFNKIHNDKLIKMAMDRARIYAIEQNIKERNGHSLTKEEIDKIIRDTDYDWYAKRTQIERESNVYACLSIRSALHLIGLDYTEMSDDVKCITEKEYLDKYATGDEPEYYDFSNGEKKIIKYDTVDFKNSLRKTLAIHEHYRWNSFEISKGMIPASIDEIKKDTKSNGKDYKFLRRHGNITTFDGLIEFRRMIAARDGVGELEKDVIKYDYQLMDIAWWLLKDENYGIIRR